MKNLGLILVVAVLAVAGWFFVSPLFLDKAVDEAFTFVLDDGRVDTGRIMEMPEAKREEIREDIMDAAAAAPDQSAAEAMPAATPRVIARGNFVDADAIHRGAGVATLYELADGSALVRFEDFRTTNGPALVVYLARHTAPMSRDDVLDGGFVKLGTLKGNVGNQNYAVPPGVDHNDFHSVVVWCELFDVLFSPAALHRG